MLLLFGYGVPLDSQEVPVGPVIERPGAETASFLGAFRQSVDFAPRVYATRQAGRAALRERTVNALAVLSADFAQRLKREGGAPIQVIGNGADATSARLLEGDVQGTWSNWLQQQGSAQGRPLVNPVVAEPRVYVWAVILPNAAALALMAVFFLGLRRRLLRKRLE